MTLSIFGFIFTGIMLTALAQLLPKGGTRTGGVIMVGVALLARS